MDLQSRALLYGSFMDHQLNALRDLPGFAELPLQPPLAAQVSHKLVPPAPATWRASPMRAAVERVGSSSKWGISAEDPLALSLRLSEDGEREERALRGWGPPPPAEEEARDESGTSRGGGHGTCAPPSGHAGPSLGSRSRGESEAESAAAARGGASVHQRIQPLVVSRLFETQHLRRVRFTYFDGGSAVQAFNSLCYPRDWLDLPLLGVDLLSFGPSKLLCVIDMQPVTNSHFSPNQTERGLEQMREAFGDALFQSMSSRFFQDTRFFSPHMLLMRSSIGWQDPRVQTPSGPLFQALSKFLSLYHELLLTAPRLTGDGAMERVRQGQIEYEKYFSVTDPAIGLFKQYFGEQWSDDYTHSFLFPDALARSATAP